MLELHKLPSARESQALCKKCSLWPDTATKKLLSTPDILSDILVSLEICALSTSVHPAESRSPRDRPGVSNRIPQTTPRVDARSLLGRVHRAYLRRRPSARPSRRSRHLHRPQEVYDRLLEVEMERAFGSTQQSSWFEGGVKTQSSKNAGLARLDSAGL